MQVLYTAPHPPPPHRHDTTRVRRRYPGLVPDFSLGRPFPTVYNRSAIEALARRTERLESLPGIAADTFIYMFSSVRMVLVAVSVVALVIVAAVAFREASRGALGTARGGAHPPPSSLPPSPPPPPSHSHSHSPSRRRTCADSSAVPSVTSRSGPSLIGLVRTVGWLVGLRQAAAMPESCKMKKVAVGCLVGLPHLAAAMPAIPDFLSRGLSRWLGIGGAVPGAPAAPNLDRSLFAQSSIYARPNAIGMQLPIYARPNAHASPAWRTCSVTPPIDQWPAWAGRGTSAFRLLLSTHQVHLIAPDCSCLLLIVSDC